MLTAYHISRKLGFFKGAQEPLTDPTVEMPNPNANTQPPANPVDPANIERLKHVLLEAVGDEISEEEKQQLLEESSVWEPPTTEEEWKYPHQGMIEYVPEPMDVSKPVSLPSDEEAEKTFRRLEPGEKKPVSRHIPLNKRDTSVSDPSIKQMETFKTDVMPLNSDMPTGNYLKRPNQ